MIYCNKNLKIELFGESHGPYVGVEMSGFPAGFPVDMDDAEDMLSRRRAGREGTTPRVEDDLPEIESGIENGLTTGDCLRALFPNRAFNSAPYKEQGPVPRPGQSDYPYYAKTGKLPPAGGATSARSTVGLVFAGALCKQYLAAQAIYVQARLLKVGDVDAEDKKALSALLVRLKSEEDSAGGIIECTVHGLPAGFSPADGSKLESAIASCVYNLPAVKGLEFGAGFEAAKLRGSENNDAFYIEAGRIRTRTNNAGGVLGGMATGMPLVLRAAFKPTPSIGKEQESVNMETLEPAVLRLSGSHDICVALRAEPVLEAAVAIALADIIIGENNGAY